LQRYPRPECAKFYHPTQLALALAIRDVAPEFALAALAAVCVAALKQGVGRPMME
jgi:hypothetical protein